MSLQKLENYCMRFDTLRSSMEDDLKELMEQCLTLSNTYDIIEDETYKVLPPEDIREYMWATIGALDKHRILKQKVRIRMDTLLLINSRIKKMAKPYGLEDLLVNLESLLIKFCKEDDMNLDTTRTNEQIETVKSEILRRIRSEF